MNLERQKPLVSILMPVYNGERYLVAAIESVLAQSYSSIELMILDDGSTDKTYEIVRSFAQADSRIEVAQQANEGIPSATNRLIAKARGPLICLFDQDDIMDQSCVSELVNHILSHPEAGAVSGSALLIDADGQPVPDRNQVFGEGFTKADLKLNRELPGKYPEFANSGSLWNRQAVLSVNGYREAITFCQDYDLVLRVGAKHEIHILKRALTKYRLHQSNTHKRDTRKYEAYMHLVKLSAAARKYNVDDSSILTELHSSKDVYSALRGYCLLFRGSPVLEGAALIRVIRVGALAPPQQSTAAAIRSVIRLSATLPPTRTKLSQLWEGVLLYMRLLRSQLEA